MSDHVEVLQTMLNEEASRLSLQNYEREAIKAAISSLRQVSEGHDVTLHWRPLLQWAIGTIDELNDGPMTADQWDEDSALYANARALAFANPAPPTSGDSEADELIRSLGFDPERFRTEAGFLNHSKLRAAIKNPADYEGLMLHTTPGQWVPVKPEGAPYWGIHTATGETVAGTSSGLCEGDARLICELRNARLIAPPAQAGAELPERPFRLEVGANGKPTGYFLFDFDESLALLGRARLALKEADCDMHYHDERGVRRSLVERIDAYLAKGCRNG